TSVTNKSKKRNVTVAIIPTIPIAYPHRKKVKFNENGDQFAAIIQKARETDNELLEIMRKGPVINLPKLGLNKFQDRFHFSNEKLPFICRGHHDRISETIINMLNEGNRSKNLYIRGPSGLGKSYS